MTARLTKYFAIVALAICNLILVSYSEPVRAEDTDIFTVNPNVTSLRPNILIILDNTANWNNAFTNEIAALVTTINNLDDRFNVGLMLFPETGSPNNSVDGGYVRAAVRQMNTTNKTALANLVAALVKQGNGSDVGNNATLGLAMYEAYLYFGGSTAYSGSGKVKRDYTGNVLATASGTSNAQSNIVYALGNNAAGKNAFASSSSSTYVSPISDECAKNFIIHISNGPVDNNENGLAKAKLAAAGGNTTDIVLAENAEQSSYADEWARFLANTDVNSSLAGTQKVFTYAVDIDPSTNHQGLGHTALLKSMSEGVGKGKYFAVSSGNGGAAISDALNKIFQEVLAVNSVFASSTLPVSVNTRGTFLNQVYMGVFRPDGQASPRWPGNLKQYKTGLNSAGNLQLVDSNSNAIQNTSTGFILSSAKSFWTATSTFWDATYYPDAQGGTGGGGVSDSPDGEVVEKGGAAYKLRTTYATDLTGRKLYTCTGTCAAGSTLSGFPFSTSNTSLTSLSPTAFGISGVSNVTSLTRTGTTATATTSSAHGFTTGQSVSISGANESEYNGAFTVTVTSTTQFTFTVVENPTSPAAGTIALSQPASSFTVSSLVRAAASSDASTGGTDTATATTTAAHGLSVGNTVTLSGATQTEFNGTFSVVSVPSTTSFTFSVPINPTTPATVSSSSTATIGGVNRTITNIVRVGRTVTVTVANGNNLPGSTGSTGTVAITGVTPTAYQGSSIAYTQTGNKTFTYVLSSLSPNTPATGTITGTATSAPVTLTSLMRAAGSATATGTTATTHGLSVGNTIIISGATQTAYNGTFAVASVPTATTFTYTVSVSPASPATGSITATVTGTTSISDLINWVRGENRRLEDNPSTNSAANTYVRGYLHGDVVHSRPAIINYNRSGQPANRDLVVFYGSNDGVFHAVKGGQDATDGSELWGFVAPEFFSKFGRQYSASPVINNASSSTAKPYFADGPISTLTIDANGDNAIDSTTTGDKAYLYVGMRRGGRFLYALDVTDPTSPKLLWKIDNTTAGFSELGQTWAEAKVATIAGYANKVLIMSAGYDPVANDSATQGTATMGRGVYVIDAITGVPIWFAGPTAATGVTSTVVSGMTYAIPADASPIDSDGDGFVDRIYLADTGGNVWRANVSAVDGSGAADPANWTMTKVAALGGTGSNARKFLFGPDVVPFDGPPTTVDTILIGSGDREQPFDVSIQNRFYMIKDPHGLSASPLTPVTESNLCDLTNDALQGSDASLRDADTACLNDTAKKGWFISLLTGEKVVTNSVTLNKATTFGTNRPESTLDHTNTCSSGLGEARLYTVNFKDATALLDQNADGLLGSADRHADNLAGGLPPSPTAISVEIDGGFHEVVCSGPQCVTPPGVTIGRRTRVYWNIKNEVN